MLPLSRGFAAEEWPADVEYLDQTAWPPGAERARSQRMRGVAIARVPRCHPSHPGAGLYATRRWEACEVLGEYTGRVAGPEREGAYVLALEPDVPPADSLSVDAEAAGNEARFINDFSGLAAAPNVAFIPYRKARPSVRTTPPLHRAPAASHTTHRALRGAAGAHGRACDRRDRPALDPARGGNSRLLRGQRVACSRRAIVYAVAKVC